MEANNNAEEIKKNVQEAYSEVSKMTKESLEAGCCGGNENLYNCTIFSESYEGLDGYNKCSDLGVGCGVPTKYTNIKKGDVVLDLGSGAGNDCFVAQKLVGETGKVIGLDMTMDMLRKAWKNLDESKINNIEFRLGDIENMPVADKTVDVVISNCVINLVPDKAKAYREVFRVLKDGGNFSISDVVVNTELPLEVKNNQILYNACASGAMVEDEYLKLITECGFIGVEFKNKREVVISDDMLLKFVSEDIVQEMKKKDTKIYAVNVNGVKPKKSCC